MWQNNARGLFVEDRFGDFDPSILEGYDFLIAKSGEFFGQSVQKASDKKMPLILFFENDMQQSDVDYGMNNLPPPDVYRQFKELDRMIYIGDPKNKIKRKIHGVIVDCSTVDAAVNPTWIVHLSEYMLKNIWERYGILVYLYMNKNSINYWKPKEPEGVEGIYQLMKRHGMSTINLTAITEDNFPIDNSRPILPYDDSSIPWYFWLYGVFYVEVAQGLLFLYNGDREKMAKDLNFVYGDVTPEEEIPNDGTVPIGTFALFLNKLDLIEEKIDVVRREVITNRELILENAESTEKIKKHFNNIEEE